MKKRIFIISLFLITLSLLSSLSVYAITQQEADTYNNLYYPQSVYNGGINTSPQEEKQAAYVNPATGSTHVQVTDLSLPGRNGFDLDITRMYNSTNSALFEAYLQETDIPVEVNYYMITGNKRVYRYYTDSSWSSVIFEDVCLTPDFMEYLDEKDAEWMVKNSTKYEYDYIEDPAKSKLFSSYSEALSVVNYINSTSYEIDAYFPYDNTVDYEIDYYDFSIVAVPKIDYYTDYADGLIDDTATERYSKIGVGWEFIFPYIETRYGYYEDYQYLHFGDKGTYLIDFSSDGGTNHLAGYNLNDIILTYDSSITHDGIRSEYCVTEKDGTKHYFGPDGRLLIQQDRFGNQIKFYCDTESYENVWGDYEDYPYITRIVDTIGREVVFTYEYNTSSNKYVYMTITNPNDENDVREFSYYLDKLSSSEIGILGYEECDYLEGDEWVLYRVTDPEGKQYNYRYDYLETKFTFMDRNDTFYYDNYDWTDSSIGNSYIDDDNFDDFIGIRNSHALLRSATRTGEKSYYFKYAPFVKNCTPSGSMMFYKAYRSYEESADSYNGTSAYINDKSYQYDINGVGEYDGYIGYSRDDRISSSYNYAVKVVDNNVASGKTSYDIYKYTYLGASREKTILLTKLTSQGTEHKSITDNTYDSATKLLTGTTTKDYSVVNASDYMTLSTAYTYDSGNYADLLTQTPNGVADRAITYTYDTAYHFLLTKTYKQDSATTIREEYVPTSNGKSIAAINVYKNDVLQNKVEYSHDSYGNIVTQKQYINDTDYIETVYTYDNGVYVVNEKTKNVANIDGTSSDISKLATFDYWGNPVTQTDANGNVTEYEYDAINRVVTITNPDDSTKEYTYSTYYTREFDELNNRTTEYYNNARQSEGIYYNSLGVDYNYNYYSPYGQIETEIKYLEATDENGAQIELSRTEYAYDTAGRPISKEMYDKDGVLVYKETYSYEITSTYQKQTTTVHGGDGNPSIVTSEYVDNFGNIFKKEVGTDYETYTFDYAGNVLSVKSARANAEGFNETHTAEYDILGNVIQETDELGNTTRNEYDKLGRLIKAYDQNNYATEYKYDNLNRVIEEKAPFEVKNGTVHYSVKKIWYDNNGNISKERVYTNAAGEAEKFSEVKYTYDNRNRLIMTETNDGTTSNYVQNFYDAKGNLLRVYTGLSSPLTINGLDDVTGDDTEYAVTKYTYDAVGRPLTTTDALNQTETNVYDKAEGFVLSTTDRNGQVFNFTYNAKGEVLTKSLSDGTNAETTVYGITGVPVSKQNATTTISYTYNDKGQLISESDSLSGVSKEYTYDSAGNRITMTVKKNGTIQMSQGYVYDKLNRLISVSENGNVIATYSYDNKGNRTQTAVTGGETTTYTYNIADMLTAQSSGNQLNETFSYYLNGNQKSKVSGGITTNYTYDGMNRLVGENDTTYTFDDFGNRLTMTDGDVITSYSYDLNNRLLQSSEVNGEIATTSQYFYDNNGNQITKAVNVNQPYAEGMSGDYTISSESNGYIALYEYNCYNQLVGVDTDGVVSSYAYAPDGMRHSKTVDGITTTFVYDNSNVIEEITSSGENKYYRGLEIIKNDDNLYYLYNGQGDVAILVDASGTTVASYIFDAYGNQSEENAVYNPFGYRGEYTDSESGLIYLRARMYDTETGRFINEDPIHDGFNWYVYVGNNPIFFIDPFGLAPTAEEAAAMADHIYLDIPLSDPNDVEGNRKRRTVAGWRLIDVWNGRESMKMGIYIKDSDNWENPTEYAIVFKGTSNLRNWINNAEAYTSKRSADMWDAINYSISFVNGHSQEITFVGHSKGGGEAIAAATATNRDAITFNAANFNFAKYGLTSTNKSGINNYYVEGEALSAIIGVSRYGTTHWIPTQEWMVNTSIFGKNIKIPDPIGNHSMSAVKKGL